MILALIAPQTPAPERVRDLVYLKQGGAAFTMDAFKPEKPNGIGVVLVVSGGWFSDHKSITEAVARPLTDRGITVFEVVHGSQPRYKIDEIERLIVRSVRYVRANAGAYRVDPKRIGITGGSAGGQLSLMAAGLGDDGDPDASDPVDRASSRVQSVVAFFPPTDFLNFGGPGVVPMDAPQMAVFRPAFGVSPDAPREKILAYLKSVSPAYLVTPAFPPTLLIHGDKDPLVPLEQSRSFEAKLKAAGVRTDLVVVPGAGHSGLAFVPYLKNEADWFLATLGPK